MPKKGLELVMSQVYYPGKLDERSEEFVGDSHGIQHLIAAHYKYDDLDKPEDVMRLNAEVIALAHDWLEHYGTE